MSNFDIIIIGGGASGLCTAINAKTKNNNILIIDKSPRPGRKILATGNGKCNLTNENCKVALFDENPEGIYPYFSEGSRDFIEEVIGRYDCDDTIKFFEGLGLLLKNKNGYIYPRTEQAKTVLEVLENKTEQLGIDVLSDYRIRRITKENGLFVVDGKYKAQNLVVSTGGLSSPKNDADGFGYEIAQGFGHSVNRPRPALCALACKGKIFRDLAGVRTDAYVYVYDKDKLIIKSFGNLQFTDYGISGIPVFQISSVAGKMLEEGKKPLIKIDPLYDFSEDELFRLIKGRKDDCLLGILNEDLAHACEKTCQGQGLKKNSGEYKKKLCVLAKNFYFEPESTAPFKNSQVTAGGVKTDQIDPKTMQSEIEPGLYFTGEVIDVNGICGGYNLQWAWSTGHICADALNK